MKNEKLKIIELLVHLVFLTILVLATTRPIAAQGMKSDSMTKEATSASESSKGLTASGEKEATDGAKSSYTLPYYGLLPDHPLYIFKVIRDRIIDFLLTDNLKKAEFTLLSADKRLSMAMALVEKGKPELGESTASKGENYLDRSIALIEKAKGEGKDVTSLVNKLRPALGKHEEVLQSLAGKTEGKVSESFTKMAESVAKHRQALQ